MVKPHVVLIGKSYEVMLLSSLACMPRVLAVFGDITLVMLQLKNDVGGLNFCDLKSPLKILLCSRSWEKRRRRKDPVLCLGA